MDMELKPTSLVKLTGMLDKIGRKYSITLHLYSAKTGVLDWDTKNLSEEEEIQDLIRKINKGIIGLKQV